MFLEMNPAYILALMFFIVCVVQVSLSFISAYGNTGTRTRRIFYVTSLLVISYSLNYGLMTISEHEMLRYVFWAIGFSSGLMFFPVWVLFLLHMVPPKRAFVMVLSKVAIGISAIIGLVCIFSGHVDFSMTTYGTQFSYHNSVFFITALVSTSLLASPLVYLQFKWWNEEELLRFRKLARVFVLIAFGATSIGFVTDFIVPIFTTETVTPLGPVTILCASLTTYFLTFSRKKESITVSNVSGFTFSSIMMPILVLDRKNKIGLENKAAVDFFGHSLINDNLAYHILYESKTPKDYFFETSFTNEVITVVTPHGIRTCEMLLTVEKDKLGDTVFKVVVIRDRTESIYKDSLLEAVNQVSGILLEPDIGNFEVNLYMAMGMIAKAVDVDRVYVWENRTVNDKLRCTQIYEWSEGAEPQQGHGHTIDVSYDDMFEGLEDLLSSGYCLNKLVSDMEPKHKEHLGEQGIRSILVTPVFIQDVFWGFVGFDDCRKERDFTDNEELILRSASRLIVNAMIRNDMTRQLDTALTDELTGARSRRYFVDAAEEELRMSNENAHSYSLIIIDADYFKRVNDTYGHPVGDEVLKILVSRIRNTLKMETLFARYGGEEFVVSLPDLTHEDVMATAERIRANIESDAFKIGDLEIDVTISLGVASKAFEARTLSEIISNADKALYQAKQTGRNKVVFFEQ